MPQASDGPMSVLQAATLWPLGRVTRQVAGVPFHLLAHPAVAQTDGALDLFADVAAGDRLWQMQGPAGGRNIRAWKSDDLLHGLGKVGHEWHRLC